MTSSDSCFHLPFQPLDHSLLLENNLVKLHEAVSSREAAHTAHSNICSLSEMVKGSTTLLATIVEGLHVLRAVLRLVTSSLTGCVGLRKSFTIPEP